MSNRHSRDVFMALIIGGIIGTGLGILYAPASGKETRKKLRELEDDLIFETDEILSKGKEKILQQKRHIENTMHAAGKEIRNAGKYIENIGK